MGVRARTEDRAVDPLLRVAGRRAPRVQLRPANRRLGGRPLTDEPNVGRRRLYKTLAGKSVDLSLRQALTLPAPGRFPRSVEGHSDG
jgi:hypothetical protein